MSRIAHARAGYSIVLCAAFVACSSAGTTAPPGDAGADAGRHDGGHHPEDSGAHDATEKDARGEAEAGWAFKPTTSVAELMQNNTAACGSATAPCTGAWTTSHSVKYSVGPNAGKTLTVDGFWDHPVPAGPQAPGAALGYVSKVPVSALLPGASVPVWVETQNWWGGGSGHIDNGEVSSDAAQIKNQVDDHISRGIAGQVMDWYGQGSTADKALPFIKTNAEAAGGKYGFAVMIDKGYFGSCGETVACLNSAISYLVSTYTTSSAYLKDSSGHPLIFFFINKYYPTEYGILNSSGINDMGTRFVMYEPNGFPGDSPPNTIGEYGWVNPGDGAPYSTSTGSAGSFAWESDFGFKGLTSFLAAAGANKGSYAVSEAFKGFDDNLANWSLNRIIDQACGTTWLQSFNHTGSFGGSSAYQASLNYVTGGGHLDFVMIDTWDDYEEGSEIETGIDNCLDALPVTLAGSTLSWSPAWGQDPMNSAVTGSEATLSKYSVYVAKKGDTSLMWLADVACSGGTCGHTLDLSKTGITGGPYVFYVYAVGQPSIVNTLSPPTSAAFTR